MKALLFGLLLASPPVAAWMLNGENPAMQSPGNQPISQTHLTIPSAGTVQVPVEVVAKGSAPKVIYVEVSTQSVPEPGVVSLLALTGLLLLRRQRVK